MMAANLLAVETNPGVPELSVPRVEEVSKIKMDGKLDEPQWQNAVEIESFSLLGKGGKPKLQTKAKLFYDSQFLYLGITFFENKMDKIIPGIPAGQTEDAPISSNADCGEIFIAPEGDPLRYFHLRIIPSGAKADSKGASKIAKGGRFFLDDSWNGNWTVATHLGKKCWTAEVKISLTAFAEDGSFSGTPLQGQSWRMNICRTASTSGEFSAWSKTPGVFHIPEYFGKIVFEGWKHGEIVLKDTDSGEFILGKNTFKTKVRNASKRDSKVLVSVTLSEDKVNPEERTAAEKKRYWEIPKRHTTLFKENISLKPGEEQEINCNYKLKDGGDKKIAVRIDWERMKFGVYAGSVKKKVYPLLKNIAKIRKELDKLKRAGEVIANLLDKTLYADFKKKLNKAYRKSLRVEKQTSWKKKVGMAEQLMVSVQDLKRMYSNQLYPAFWAAEKGIGDVEFLVGTTHPTKKVFRDAIFDGKLSGNAEISMAGNEYESIQFVILYLKENIGKIDFSVSELVHQQDSGAVIKPSAITLFGNYFF